MLRTEVPIFYRPFFCRLRSQRMVGCEETGFAAGRGLAGERQLQVHHLRYRLGLAPWEYDDEELITLCIDCHKHTHATSRIPVFDDSVF